MSMPSPLTESAAFKPATFETALQLPGFIDAINERAIIAVTDHEDRFVFVNDAFCAISKYSREDLVGQHYTLIGSGHQPQSYFDEIKQTLMRGEVWQGRIKNRAKDGSHYWVDAIAVPIMNDAGELAYSVSVRNEITELVTAQEKLEHNRQGEAAIRRILAIALSDIGIERMLEGSLEVISLVPWMAPVKRSAVFLVDPESKQIGLVASRDLGSIEASISGNVCFGTCICTQASVDRTVTIETCTRTAASEEGNAAAEWEHYAIPLVSQGGLVLTAMVGETQIINRDNFLTDVAKALSVGIEQKNIQNGLKAEREQVTRKQQQLEDFDYTVLMPRSL